jgi:hypothetical protein
MSNVMWLAAGASGITPVTVNALSPSSVIVWPSGSASPK